MCRIKFLAVALVMSCATVPVNEEPVAPMSDEEMAQLYLDAMASLRHVRVGPALPGVCPGLYGLMGVATKCICAEVNGVSWCARVTEVEI